MPSNLPEKIEEPTSNTVEITSRRYFIETKDICWSVGPGRGALDKDECIELSKVLETRIVDGDVYMTLPDELAKYKTVTKTAQCCAYNSTKDYLEAMLGRKLSDADRSWYVSLSHVQESGLPYEHTLSVLQALVKPYGVGISEVILKPGSPITAEQKQFMLALRCNPMAMSDRETSNEKFNEQTKMDTSKFRFNYSQYAVGPCVITNEMGNTHYASGGGHATFMPPRRYSESSVISIRYDYLHLCDYAAPIPELDETPSVQQKSLDLNLSTVPDGRTFQAFFKEEVPRPTPTYGLYRGGLFGKDDDKSNKPDSLPSANDPWWAGYRCGDHGSPPIGSNFDTEKTNQKFYSWFRRNFHKGMDKRAPALLRCAIHPKDMSEAIEDMWKVSNYETTELLDEATAMNMAVVLSVSLKRKLALGDLQEIYEELVFAYTLDAVKLVFEHLIGHVEVI